MMGRGRYPCVGNVLLGGGASGSILWIRIMSHVRGDDEDGGGNPYNLPKAYNEEEGTEKHIWDVGDTGGRRGVEGSWNADIGHMNRPQEGDGVTGGGSKTNI